MTEDLDYRFMNFYLEAAPVQRNSFSELQCNVLLWDLGKNSKSKYQTQAVVCGAGKGPVLDIEAGNAAAKAGVYILCDGLVTRTLPRSLRRCARLPHFNNSVTHQFVQQSDGVRTSSLALAFGCGLDKNIIAKAQQNGYHTVSPAYQFYYTIFHICEHWTKGPKLEEYENTADSYGECVKFNIVHKETDTTMLFEVLGVFTCPDGFIPRPSSKRSYKNLETVPVLLVRTHFQAGGRPDHHDPEAARLFMDTTVDVRSMVQVYAESAAELLYAKELLSANRRFLRSADDDVMVAAGSGFEVSVLFPANPKDLAESCQRQPAAAPIPASSTSSTPAFRFGAAAPLPASSTESTPVFRFGAAASVTEPASASRAPAQEPSPLRPGDQVHIHGLANAVQHNGKRGILRSFDAWKGRWAVEVIGRPKALHIKTANLRSVPTATVDDFPRLSRVVVGGMLGTEKSTWYGEGISGDDDPMPRMLAKDDQMHNGVQGYSTGELIMVGGERLVIVLPDVGEPEVAVRPSNLRILTDSDEQPLREINELHPNNGGSSESDQDNTPADLQRKDVKPLPQIDTAALAPFKPNFALISREKEDTALAYAFYLTMDYSDRQAANRDGWETVAPCIRWIQSSVYTICEYWAKGTTADGQLASPAARAGFMTSATYHDGEVVTKGVEKFVISDENGEATLLLEIISVHACPDSAVKGLECMPPSQFVRGQPDQPAARTTVALGAVPLLLVRTLFETRADPAAGPHVFASRRFLSSLDGRKVVHIKATSAAEVHEANNMLTANQKFLPPTDRARASIWDTRDPSVFPLSILFPPNKECFQLASAKWPRGGAGGGGSKKQNPAAKNRRESRKKRAQKENKAQTWRYRWSGT